MSPTGCHPEPGTGGRGWGTTGTPRHQLIPRSAEGPVLMCNFRSLHHFGSAGRCLAARGHGGCSCRGGDRAAPAPLCPVLAAGRGRRELRPARLVTAMALQQELTHSLQPRFYPRRRGWRSQQPLPAPSGPELSPRVGPAAVGCWCRIRPRRQRAGARGMQPGAADGFWSPAGLEPEESSKSGSKKLDAMTLIKEGKLPTLGRKPVVRGPRVP